MGQVHYAACSMKHHEDGEDWGGLYVEEEQLLPHTFNQDVLLPRHHLVTVVIITHIYLVHRLCDFIKSLKHELGS